MMSLAGLRRLPSGRAGRLWLTHRLDIAHRGAELLDLKLRILHAERQRLALLLRRTNRAWQASSRQADVWQLRAVTLGGQRAIRLARPATPADVTVTWTASMGVHYPSEASCTIPEPERSAPPAANSALIAAADAYRRALEAAVQHAVALAALAVMEMAEASTRRRLRAIENWWIPRLEGALAKVRIGIEENEHAEAVRLRWAMERRSRTGAREETRE